MSGQYSPERSNAVLDQAIGWQVRLQSGSASGQLQEACRRWRQADPRHEMAWQALQTSESDFQRLAAMPDISGRVAVDTLERLQSDGHSRRQALKLLGVGLFISGLGGWGLQERSLYTWGVDYATGVGQRRQFTLNDGTRVQLNTASAVDVQFSAERRLITLQRGEIFIDTGKDAAAPGGKREFWVQSRHAQLQALGTAFAVRLEEWGTRLRVEESVVVIHQNGQQVRVEAGEEYLISADGNHKAEHSSMNASAWTRGQLMAKRMRMGDLTAELARYRRGWLSCDPQIAELQVSGVFQLDDIDQVLSALQDLLPVRVERFTPLWSRVVAR